MTSLSTAGFLEIKSALMPCLIFTIVNKDSICSKPGEILGAQPAPYSGGDSGGTLCSLQWGAAGSTAYSRSSDGPSTTEKLVTLNYSLCRGENSR